MKINPTGSRRPPKAAVHHLTRSLGRRVGLARGPGERSRAWLREDRHVVRRRPGAPSTVDRLIRAFRSVTPEQGAEP
jgi:hypothetical protein